MSTLITLVKMQLREKLNLKTFSTSKSDLFNLLLNAAVAVLKIAFITVICYAFILLAKIFSLFQYIGVVPQSVMSFVFIVMLIASTFGCTIGLTKALYYSRDNAVLLTLPAVPMQIFLSKIIIFYIFELKRSLSFIVPMFLAYYFCHGYSVASYIWMLFCFAFVAMFTVALGALLSIPGMWIANVFNQYKLLQNICLVLIVGSVVGVVVYAIAIIPTNLDFYDQIGVIKIMLRQFFDGLAYYNPNAIQGETLLLRPIYNLTLLFLGDDKFAGFSIGGSALRFLILIGITIVLASAAVLIVKPLFYKMASTPFEYKKRAVKEKKNLKFDKRIAALAHEFRLAIKTPERMFANVGILISVPVLIMLLNKVFAAMNVKELGEFMIVAFNILIILLVILNANTYASSIYSRDGRSAYLIKTQPTNPIWLILAKLVPNTVFVTVSLIITTVIMDSLTSLSTSDSVILMLGLYFIYLTHLFMCAEFDLMNPQTEIYATVGNNDSNPNETKSTAFAFGAAFAIALVVMLLLSLHENQNVYLKLMLVALAALVYKVYIFLQKIKLYYKEK